MNPASLTSPNRRDFVKIVGVGAMSLLAKGPTVMQAGEGMAGQAMHAARSLLLTGKGGDRATAYVTSGKIAHRKGLLVCTWLDVERQNRWALIDPNKAEILRDGVVGEPCMDNHCGAALAADVDGTLHLLVGAHHGAFIHYRMPPDEDAWKPVEDGREVSRSGTYPSLVCDREGTLHVTYRHEPGGRNARLYYVRRPKLGSWSQPRALVANAVSEHSWLTNAIEVGPEGRLHAVLSNTLPAPGAGPNGRYYGASHLYSDDSGQSWRQFGDAEPLVLPAPAARLKRIEGDAMNSDRIERDYGGPRGPENSYYHKILLSNVSVDDRGRPWVILHNLLKGTAALYHHEAPTGWVGVPLEQTVATILPGFQIRHCGQLSRHKDGTIEAVLMAAPADERGWGTKGTELVRLLVDPDGDIRDAELVCPPDADMPHWLPSIERWCWQTPIARPALLYTRGINAGGYSKNRNQVNTEVVLQLFK